MSTQNETEVREVNPGRFLDKMVNMRAWTDDEDLVSKGTFIEEKDGLTHIEISGRVTAVNPNGQVFIFKPRSQRTTGMIETENVTHIELAGSATLRPVGQKSLRPLTVQNARRHLADFHAVPLTELNGMSDELALQRHNEIDHADLGHNHDLAENGLNSKAAPTTAGRRAAIMAAINAA